MHSFGDIMSTQSAQAEQVVSGSSNFYAGAAERLGSDEISFLTTCTSFHMMTITETGWPCVQHCEGPVGFVKVLDPQTLGCSVCRENHQYDDRFTLAGDERVSLFFMEGQFKARLKISGNTQIQSAADAPEIVAQLKTNDEDKLESVMIMRVTAFDWNCPQFITSRSNTKEPAVFVGPKISRLETRVAALETEDSSLRAQKERK